MGNKKGININFDVDKFVKNDKPLDINPKNLKSNKEISEYLNCHKMLVELNVINISYNEEN